MVSDEDAVNPVTSVVVSPELVAVGRWNGRRSTAREPVRRRDAARWIRAIPLTSEQTLP